MFNTCINICMSIEQTLYTIYKITNLVNGKIYIGMHKTDNLDDAYYGSGKLIKLAIEKYGIENFTKEYIAIVDNEAKMIELESELVNETFIERDDTYNIKLGGKGGFDHIDNSGKSRPVEVRESISKGMKKVRCDEEYNKKLLLACRKARLQGKIPNPPPFTGKLHTEESKRKIGEANSKHQQGKNNSQYGTCWIYNTDLKQCKKIPLDRLDDYMFDGWIRGRKMKF